MLFHQNSESSIDIPAIENETNKFLITEHTSLAYFGFDIQGIVYYQNKNVDEFFCLQRFQLIDRSIIDFGCGNGHFLQAAARRGATKVYGLDNSSAAIEKAKLEWKELQECDSVDATFGVVDCIKSPINSMLDKDCGRFDYAISHCLTGYCQTKHGNHSNFPLFFQIQYFESAALVNLDRIDISFDKRLSVFLQELKHC